MKIEKLKLKNNLILAPMAGYTDVAFREICKQCGAALTVTEMVSAKALLYKSSKTEDLLVTSNLENPTCVQLFGHEPEVFEQVVKFECLQKFDIIDLNMGCPAPKIFKNGDGSALLKDINLAQKVISACVKNTNKPITVKFRLGVDENSNVATEFAKACEEAGASLISVHGRFTSQGYSGSVNLEEIARVKQSVKIPVVTNGDVVNKQTYLNALKQTGCDGVMIGRGALGNPFVFCEILGKTNPFTKKEAIFKHYNMLFGLYDNTTVLLNMRKHLAQYLKNENIDKTVKQQLLLENNINNLLNSLDKIL